VGNTWHLQARLHQGLLSVSVHLCLQVGYVIPGIKDVKAARVGDTWHLAKQPVQPLPGFKPIKPMVFAGGPPMIHRPPRSY
jgi:translation elongation factor EF-4